MIEAATIDYKEVWKQSQKENIENNNQRVLANIELINTIEALQSEVKELEIVILTMAKIFYGN